MRTYRYLGDRFTAPEYRGKDCTAVERAGKCVRGKNGNMLVQFGGVQVVVLARLLRKTKQTDNGKETNEQTETA